MRDRTRLRSERDDFDRKPDMIFNVAMIVTVMLSLAIFAAIIAAIVLAWKAWG